MVSNGTIFFQYEFNNDKNWCSCFLLFCRPSEELSDEYQTDYDEEAVESALSDFEAFTPGSEYTEGEETADTAETVRIKPTSFTRLKSV